MKEPTGAQSETAAISVADTRPNSERTMPNLSQFSAASLPGRGCCEHPFVYTGEWDVRKPDKQSIFVVKERKIVWQYSIPLETCEGRFQEFDDVTMLSNGDIAFSCMSGAGLIAPDKAMRWEYIAPAGTEVHSCQWLGKDRVLIMRNGDPAKALIMNTVTGRIEHEVRIPTSIKDVHKQFRHVRMTKENTILVPHLNESKVVEYDLRGTVVWSMEADTPWHAVRLANGNTLVAGDRSCYVREMNKKGDIVWDFTQADAPEYALRSLQTASRLTNGNTVITNWIADDKDTSRWPGTVQVLEVSPNKSIVWALSSWDEPDLGPATSIQLLDDMRPVEDQER